MIYRFGKFQLDDELFELRFGSEVRGLPRKSFDLLRYLVSNSGRVVTKTELFAHLWEGEHVSDSVLPVNIRTIRRALGDEASEEILKTVRGRGYVIACPVERFDGSIRQTREPSSSHPSFVGRGELMESLRSEYRSVLAGQGRTVLLYGEGGIGKSRIVEEFARWARGETALVLQSKCSADPGAPPFWPIVELLRGTSGLLQSPELSSALESTSFDAERARTRVIDFFTNNYRGAASLDSRVFELTRILLRIVQLTSSAFPIVFVIDDLHRADEPTLRVLASICRELPRSRVLAVCTYQESELRRSSAAARLIGSVASLDGVRQLALRGLDPKAVEEFIASELGFDPPRPVVEELTARTEGNPFFLRETVRLIQAEGTIRSGVTPDFSRLGVPHGVRESIRRRLDGLSAECLEVLAWASVIGRRFAFPLLAEVCRLPTARLLSLLGEAADGRLIGTHEGPDTPLPVGEFSFAHALIRQTIYEEVSGAERVLRHRAVGEALERMHGRPTYEDVVELAYHFFEAAPGGDIDRATDYCVRAGHGAMIRFHYEEAVRHFDRALRAEQLRVPRHEVRYSSVRLGRGDALWRAGRYAEAQEEFLAAAEVVREARQYDMLGLIAIGLAGWPRFERMAVGEEGQAELAQVIAITEEALRGIAPERESMRARLLSVLARAGHMHWDGEPIADLALSLARQSGEPRALFPALLAKLTTQRSPIHVKEALDLATQALSISRDQHKWQLRTFAAYEARIPILWTVGDMAGADRDLTAAAQLAAKVGVPAYEYSVARFQLGRALGNGELIRARTLLDRMAEVGDRAGDRGARLGQLLIRLWLLEAEGRADSAGRAVDALAAGGHLQGPHAAAFVATFYQTLGDRERCAEYFEKAAVTDFSEPDTEDAWLWHLAMCADVCAFLVDARRAERLYDLIYPYEHLNITNVRLRCYRGSAAYPLALLATTLDRRDDAQRHFEVALEFNQRIGARPALLWTQYWYGRLLRNGSPAERRQSRTLLAEALRSASEIGLQAMLGPAEDSAI